MSVARAVTEARRVVVVGGGIAGLTTAYRLASEGADVVVLEADDVAGGKVRSAHVGGIWLDAGPDSMLVRKPWAIDLCRELGLGDALEPPRAAAARVVTTAGLLPLPSGPYGISTDLLELARWPGLSWAGKLRAAGDLVRPPRHADGDESLGALLRRRLGNEVVETLLAPLLGGLFAGDVDRLSVLATFPELAAWERRGGLIRGARAAVDAVPAGPRSPGFLSLRGGLDRLTETLTDALGERLRTGERVEAVDRVRDELVVHAETGDLVADAVVLATPAFVTSDLIAASAADAAAELRRIAHVSTAVVLLVYGDGTNARLPDSSGFLAPRGRPVTGCTIVSRKWPDPSFGDRAVVRAFVGSAGAGYALARSDDELIARVSAELASHLGLPSGAEDAVVVRWPDAMPQYAVGHLDLVDRIERSLPPGVFVTGQSYRGTGLPDCVRGAERTAGLVRQRAVEVRPR
ncbi:MAG: protoporphyrinogen oxidase [Actinomycetota bacterium]